MTRALILKKYDAATEIMNCIASHLLEYGFIECEENCGVQEAAYCLCDFEIHVIKKRKR